VLDRDVVTIGHYLMADVVMALSVLEAHSPIVSLFKCDISYLWHVAWALCICRLLVSVVDQGTKTVDSCT